MIKSHNRTFLLRELQALASQVTGEEVILIEGDVGSSWSWNWRDRVITVDPRYLSDRSADVCRAILLHESAHCAITRIHHVLPRERHLLYQDILNVLEDLRIESWLANIFPGCATWIYTANSLIFRSVSSMNWPVSYQGQFLRAILETAHSGEIPSGVAPIVRTALDETSEAVKAQTACHPAIARGRAAARETFNAQQRMLAIFEEKIHPVWERLVALDECEGRQRITALGAKFALSGNGPKNTMISRIKKGKDSQAEDASEPTSTQKRSYLSRQNSLHRVIDTLANDFIELFETNSRQKLVLHQRSGDSIHIRTAMQTEADPRLHDKLWIRRLRNKRFDPLVILALDISGSMDGENFDAAFDGVVVLSEVCLRSGIPLALWSFNNIARQILQPHNQTNSGARRASIDQLRSQCRGGTSMEIALAHIHSSPEITQFSHPIVFVISDGKPEDESSTAAQIKKFESEKIPLIGIGIGPETREMSTLFKNSVVAVNITAVASTICDTVRKSIFENLNHAHVPYQLHAA
jgi:uncharacterized protein YegL